MSTAHKKDVLGVQATSVFSSPVTIFMAARPVSLHSVRFRKCERVSIRLSVFLSVCLLAHSRKRDYRFYGVFDKLCHMSVAR